MNVIRILVLATGVSQVHGQPRSHTIPHRPPQYKRLAIHQQQRLRYPIPDFLNVPAQLSTIVIGYVSTGF